MLTLLYQSGGQLKVASSFSPTALSTLISRGGFYNTQAVVSAPVAIWDERAAVGDWPDLRVWRRVPAGCSMTMDECFMLASGATCGLVDSVPVCQQGGRVLADVQLTPFSRGPAMGVYADYDDWAAMQHGICFRLQEAQAAFGGPYVSNCGPRLPWAEPTAGGMSIVSPPSVSDRTLNPHLYETPDVICQSE